MTKAISIIGIDASVIKKATARLPLSLSREGRSIGRASFLGAGSGLSTMSRVHREIMHLARLLDRLAVELWPDDANRYLVRDAQRAIESIDALVRLHNAQEQDTYEHVASVADCPGITRSAHAIRALKHLQYRER